MTRTDKIRDAGVTPQRAEVPICPKCGAATYSVLHVTECSTEVPIQSPSPCRVVEIDGVKIIGPES